MAYGIIRQPDGRSENDIALQSSTRLISGVAYGGITGHLHCRFGSASLRMPTRTEDFPFERSRNVSTLAVQGYRPVTTMYWRPIGQIPALLNATSSGVTSEGVDYEFEAVNYPIYLDYSVRSNLFQSIENRVAPRIARQLTLLEADYGVLLGEGRESLKYLVLLARRLHAAYNAVRRGKLQDLRRVLQVIHKGKWKPAHATSLWLEFRYGITPLLADIEAVSKDLRRQEAAYYRMFRVSASGYSSGNYQTGVVGPALLPFSVSGVRVQTGRYGYVLRSLPGYAGWVDGQFRALSDARSILTRLIDPLSVAWELTPLSFVADWFSSMGDYLSYYGSLYKNVEIVTGYRRMDVEYKRQALVTLSGTNVSFPATLDNIGKSYERVRITSFPNMTVEFQGDLLSLNRWIDAFALLKSSLRRKTK